MACLFQPSRSSHPSTGSSTALQATQVDRTLYIAERLDATFAAQLRWRKPTSGDDAPRFSVDQYVFR